MKVSEYYVGMNVRGKKRLYPRKRRAKEIRNNLVSNNPLKLDFQAVEPENEGGNIEEIIPPFCNK